MRNKARKFIWSAPLVAALAIIGALTLAGVLLMPNADTAEAVGEPVNFVAIASPTEIDLGWAAGSVPGLDGYDVEIRTGTADFATPAAGTCASALDATAVSCDITGLTNGTSYDVRIRASSSLSGQDSEWVTRTGITPTAAVKPGAPTGLMLSENDTTITTADVSWTPPTNTGGQTITGYVVSISPSDNSETCSPGGATDTSTTCTSLQAGVEYTITVYATNGVDDGTEAGRNTVSGTVTVGQSTATLMADTDSSSAAVKLTLSVTLREHLNSGSWVEIYLEDDYVEPGSIPAAAVVFVATGGGADAAAQQATRDANPVNTAGANTGGGGPVAAAAVEVDDGGDLAGEDNAVVISARVPDMDASDDRFGYPASGQTLTMIVSAPAGIKNPSEAGTHDNGFAIIHAGTDRAEAAEIEDIATGMRANDAGKLVTKAKISLSAEDGGRGKEITITGSGFNNGTTAEAFVYVSNTEPTGDDACQMVVDMGDSLGSAVVGSDDKFAITFTVHQDEFDIGEVNYICAKDGEPGNNRYASAVKSFDMTDSLSVSPAEVSAGDEVTVKPREFPMATTDGPAKVILNDGGGDVVIMGDDLTADGSDYLFDMPGGLDGTVNLRFERGGENASAKITVLPATLGLSKTEVAPNESIVITGDGFSEGSYIDVEQIKIDGQPLAVDESGTETMGDMEVVKITSGGTFSATVRVWSESGDNPALDDGTYKIKVKDADGFTGSASITILEPTLMVHPEIAGPRDYIKISGANWPVSTSDADQDVTITINEGAGQTRDRSTGIDSTGRFYYEYQLRSTVQLGKDHTITVLYEDDGGDIEEEITFAVPSSNVTITPEMARPGQTVTLELTGMPIIELVDEVIIDGSNRLHNVAYTTDPNGDVTVEVVVPYADPGFYPVRIVVEDVTAIVQLEILGEVSARGAAVPLPDALDDLGDNLEAVFYFDNVGKTWAFYDPRPEFAELNTLTELAENNPYWILIKEDQDAVLNGQTHSLSCVGTDCWNLVIW